MDSFDPSEDNPFASYLCKLKAELDRTDIDVDSGELVFGSPLKFPDYDICRDELNRIANFARRSSDRGVRRFSRARRPRSQRLGVKAESKTLVFRRLLRRAIARKRRRLDSPKPIHNRGWTNEKR